MNVPDINEECIIATAAVITCGLRVFENKNRKKSYLTLKILEKWIALALQPALTGYRVFMFRNKSTLPISLFWLPYSYNNLISFRKG